MLKENRRTLQLAEKGEWHRLLSSHLENYPRIVKKTTRTGVSTDTSPCGRSTHGYQKWVPCVQQSWQKEAQALGFRAKKAGNNSLLTLQRGLVLRTDISNLQQQTGRGTRNCRRTIRRRLLPPPPRWHRGGQLGRPQSETQGSGTRAAKHKDRSKHTRHREFERGWKKRITCARSRPRILGTMTQNQRWATTKDFDEQDDEEADLARLAIERAEAAKKQCEAIKELSEILSKNRSQGTWLRRQAHTKQHSSEST